MTDDDRFDPLLRSALEWQADRAARRAPTLHDSVRVVVGRLHRSPVVPTARVTSRHDTGRAVQLVLLAVLLLALAGAVIAIGSRVAPHPAPPIRPGPFGFAAPCATHLAPDVVLRHESGGAPTTLYDTGLLVTNRSTSDVSRASQVTGARFGERRLTQRGRRLLVEAVREAGLTEGCRTVRTTSAAGTLTVSLPDGVAHLSWGPETGVDIRDDAVALEREQRTIQLAEALAAPEQWLPEDAWQDSVERVTAPERWLLVVGMMPTDYRPGDQLSLPDGPVIQGSDPRYAAVVLPDGLEALEFGEQQPLDGRLGTNSEERCGVLDAAEALAFGESLDAQDLGADGYGDMFATDLSYAIGFELEPAYPPGRDCAARTAEWQQRSQPPVFRSPVGDLADVDPCDLIVPPVEELVGSSNRTRIESRAAIEVGAWSCDLIDPVGGLDARIANVTLYPRTTTLDEAERLVDELFGADVQRRTAAGSTVWSVPCSQPGPGCPQRAAGWSDGRLLIFEVERFFVDAARNPTADELAEAIWTMLDERGP